MTHQTPASAAQRLHKASTKVLVAVHQESGGHTYSKLTLNQLMYKLEAFADPPPASGLKHGWLPDEIELLTSWWLAGRGRKEIARKLGRSHYTVSNKRCMLGLPKRKGGSRVIWA